MASLFEPGAFAELLVKARLGHGHMAQDVENAEALMRPEALRALAQTTPEGWVVRDSLPEPERASFESFLVGSCCPLGDGLQKYAYAYDFERWLALIELASMRTPRPP